MTANAESQCRIEDPTTGMAETLGYMEMEGDQLYFVQHHAKDEARGGVVICGPIGANRERAYRTLVDLSRALALQGYEVLRFDYRGIGESTGRFERLCMSDWKRDVERCISFLSRRVPGLPVALWGVRAGALLASECFGDGAGDAMMLCSPMAGKAILEDIFRRNMLAEMITRPTAPRMTTEECLARLKNRELVNVDGYFWSMKLWEDAEGHPLTLPDEVEKRAWRIVDYKGASRTELAAWAEPNREIESGDRFWESGAPLVPKSGRLIDRTVAWVRSVFCPKG